MKVVIDANIFVSSFFGGNPQKIIDLWKHEKITLCLSKDVLDEYIEVLQGIGLQDEDELGELLSLFKKGFNMLFTTKTPKVKVVKDDEFATSRHSREGGNPCVRSFLKRMDSRLRTSGMTAIKRTFYEGFKDDPDDDKFIECAMALKAEVIVTGDKAIEAVGEYMGIKILTPQRFLKSYEWF
jgi:uncharacterized protein